MKQVLIGGAATMLAAGMGWISFGHLAALLGLEILVALWFSRLRTIHSLGPVHNPHAKTAIYTVKVDGQEVQRTFAPVQGQPLSTEDRLWLARNNSTVLAAGGGMAILVGVVADPSFFTLTELLILAALTALMAAGEHQRHSAWMRAGRGRTADPTWQMTHESWRLLVFIGFMFAMFMFFGVPRLLAYAMAVMLLASDLFLHGKRERWTGEVAPTP